VQEPGGHQVLEAGTSTRLGKYGERGGPEVQKEDECAERGVGSILEREMGIEKRTGYRYDAGLEGARAQEGLLRVPNSKKLNALVGPDTSWMGGKANLNPLGRRD